MSFKRKSVNIFWLSLASMLSNWGSREKSGRALLARVFSLLASLAILGELARRPFLRPLPCHDFLTNMYIGKWQKGSFKGFYIIEKSLRNWKTYGDLNHFVSTGIHQWWIQGRGSGAPYFWTKLRPEGSKKNFFETAAPLSQGLDDRTPLPLSEGLDLPLFMPFVYFTHHFERSTVISPPNHFATNEIATKKSTRHSLITP